MCEFRHFLSALQLSPNRSGSNVFAHLSNLKLESMGRKYFWQEKSLPPVSLSQLTRRTRPLGSVRYAAPSSSNGLHGLEPMQTTWIAPVNPLVSTATLLRPSPEPSDVRSFTQSDSADWSRYHGPPGLIFQSSTVPLVPVIRTSMIAPSSKEPPPSCDWVGPSISKPNRLRVSPA